MRERGGTRNRETVRLAARRARVCPRVPACWRRPLLPGLPFISFWDVMASFFEDVVAGVYAESVCGGRATLRRRLRVGGDDGRDVRACARRGHTPRHTPRHTPHATRHRSSLA